MDVGDQPLELRFGAVRGEVGDLRLEGDDQVLRRVDDGGAELEDARRVAAHRAGKARRVGVEADAEQRAVGALGAASWSTKLIGAVAAVRRCVGARIAVGAAARASAAALPM